MHRYLLAGTAMIALAASASAETISTAITQPVRTSTIKNGTPDSITISKDGSVKPASGTAVTMDSNHSVTNQGTVAIGNSSNATGILATAGTSGDITNSGAITIDEPYAPTDTDNDGDLDGPFALGSNRFGIRTAGAHSGNVINSGTITVEGNDSAGIWLGGPLTGALTHNGTTTVTGDRAVGVHAEAVTGNVRLAGTVTARGVDAIAAHFAGDVTGAMVVQGAISSSGYRHTTAPSDPSKLDADDLLQGGPALLIEGNVTGGIVLAVPPKDASTTDDDEDDDGIKDSEEGKAAVASYGAAPAMLIGATDRDIAIGPVAGTASGFGLIVDGTVTGQGVYTGANGNGLVIGGRGGNVTIANGIGISGGVGASSKDATATALRIGSGASVPVVHNSGTVSATTGNTAASRAIAVQIDAGAAVPTIRNTGTIKATTTGTTGSATAILDLGGGLTLIENSGTISAADTTTDAKLQVAIDLSVNTSGATVKQTQVGSGIAAPSIVGHVRFGGGNDVFDVADGTVKGNVTFGGGTNTLKLSGDAVQTGNVTFGSGVDAMSLAGKSRFNGTVDFGGGADTLSIAGTAVFSGNLTNAGSLAVNLTSGGLDIARPVSIGSLTVGEDGVILATLDKTAGEGTLYTVAGNASFADGATLAVKLADVDDAEGRYTVIQAGSISGLADLETNTDLIPFMFKASLATNAAPNTIAVDVARKTTTELELNRSQAAAYNAIFAAIGEDEDIEDVFLGITKGDVFRGTLRQMLPDHAGGAFEGVSMGTRAFARQVADPPSPVHSFGRVDVLFSAAAWSSDKEIGATEAYNLGGFGFSATGEVDTPAGSFGASANWLWNEYDTGSDLNRVLSDTYELAGYWRGRFGQFMAYGRGSIGLVDFSGRRTFVGAANGETVSKDVQGDWRGTLITATGGVSYEGRAGGLFFRPAVSVDYLRLDEDGYTETGGGDALDLIVEDRKSDEFAVNGGLTLGFDFIGRSGGSPVRPSVEGTSWFRLETEGGWREIVGGSLGSTTARFGEDGTEFTLDPEQVSSGWYARLRAVGGGTGFEIGGEVGAEDRHDRTALTLRGTVRVGF
jgi:hypothetical protein